MKTRKLNAPWKKFYSKEQLEFEIPNISMYQMIRERAYEIKNVNAYLHSNDMKKFKLVLRLRTSLRL